MKTKDTENCFLLVFFLIVCACVVCGYFSMAQCFWFLVETGSHLA